ncbi:hypothetical protein RF11_14178 [Thelohanellus kitauei]|uniref:Phosphatidic acid phosphatase type 2/haloperoxidase domain-containing protein n=1 Tax=Thelohanellus kitauei TaxID=669202 RepID=A0A0C2JS80_THEKT|nr:hypothetical protein RF11_14178 [Thelohanellus kitauei]
MGVIDIIIKADFELSKFINRLYRDNAGAYVNLFFKFWEFIGNGVFTIPFNILLIMMLPKFKNQIFIHIFHLQVIDLFVCLVVKLVFRKRRPSYQENVMIGSVPLVDEYSFHSGHTSRMASLYLFLMMEDPQMSPFVILVVLVSLSRIFLGRHTVIDVVFGAIFGVLQTLFYTKHKGYFSFI